MSTQFDQVFEGLSKNSLTLEDACRVLYSESQMSPESMRECCERIEIELSQGRITSDAAQLLLDALGERSQEDQEAAAAGEEVWVDVPLEPLEGEAPRGAGKTLSDTITEVDLTMDDLLAALDRRGVLAAKLPVELDPEVAAELAAPVEWVEWEPEEPVQVVPALSSAAAPVDLDSMLEAELDLGMVGQVVLGLPVEVPVSVVDPIPLEPEGSPKQSPEQSPEQSRDQTTTPAITALSAEVEPVLTPPAAVAVIAVEELDAAFAEPAVVAQLPSMGGAEVARQPEVALHVEDPVPVPLSSAENGAAAASEMQIESTALASDPTVSAWGGGSSLAALQRVASIEPEAVVVPADMRRVEVKSNLAVRVEPTIDEVFAPRVEHVLKESVPMAVGALLKHRYRVVGSLTAGGLGQLFEAIDTQTAGAPRVALKLIEVDWQEEPRAFETLQAIVRHVRRLRHPNILSVLDIDRDDRHAIIVMEPLRGSWLSGLVRDVRGRGVGYAVAWNIIAGIANGLAYAHQHGAVHSELNPHMVFLSDTGQVKIVGFGLAHAMPMSTEPLTELDGRTLRSYADIYCATHWILGSTPQGVDDLYPLGIIAYELLTGAHPFKGASPAVAASQQLQPLPIPGLDRRIRRVIERCLSFDRKDRPASGASFLAHIEPADKLMDLVRERFNMPRDPV